VDTSKGQVTSNGVVASESRPNALCLSPPHKFLFSTGQDSGRMASFDVNSDSVELTSLETYQLGNGLCRVSIAELPG
ncbi:uncharacterized protein METZ01_LOCUS36835, partial [marine metagenome]